MEGIAKEGLGEDEIDYYLHCRLTSHTVIDSCLGNGLLCSNMPSPRSTPKLSCSRSRPLQNCPPQQLHTASYRFGDIFLNIFFPSFFLKKTTSSVDVVRLCYFIWRTLLLLLLLQSSDLECRVHAVFFVGLGNETYTAPSPLYSSGSHIQGSCSGKFRQMVEGHEPGNARSKCGDSEGAWSARTHVCTTLAARPVTS